MAYVAVDADDVSSMVPKLFVKSDSSLVMVHST